MKKYYKEKKTNVKAIDLRKATCSKSAFLLSNLIDMLLLIVPLFLMLYFSPQLMLLIIVMYLILQFLFFTLAGGRTIGKILFGLHYVNQDSYQRLRWTDYTIYVLESFFDHWKMNDEYQLFSKLFNRYHQSPIDREYGILLVNSRSYKYFLNKYKAK